MKNWKTLTAGIGSILFGLSKAIEGDWATAIPSLIAGVGLVFAKDFNVTGGTIPQDDGTVPENQALQDKAEQ